MLYGVSVGPGDPELMTLKAVRILRACTVSAVPRSGSENTLVAFEIARQAVPEIENKRIMELSLPMTRDKQLLEEAREQAAKTLMDLLDAGEEIACLTLGDASIYSTYMYLHNRIVKAGYPAEIIAGVPSFCAAAALRGKQLTEAALPLHIVPGSYDCVEESLSWPGPKILMKSGKQLGRVKALLKEKGLLDQAYLVQECGMEHEKACPLNQAEDAGYFSIVFVEDKI